MGQLVLSDEVKAEIEKLKAMKPKVRHFSFFGEDNHAAIDAQLYVLENTLDEDEIWARYPYADDEYERSAALDVLAWLDGEEDAVLQSQEWEGLVQ